MDELLESIDAIAQEAFADVVAQYSIHVDSIIESLDAFSDLGFNDWDIVDTGRLLNSKMVLSTANKAEFEWSPKSPKTGFAYAPVVWTGFMSRSENYIPGRHWPERAASTLKDVGVTQAFVNALSDRGLDVELEYNGDEDLDT